MILARLGYYFGLNLNWLFDPLTALRRAQSLKLIAEEKKKLK